MSLRFVVKQKMNDNDIVNVFTFTEQDGFVMPVPERMAELIRDIYANNYAPIASDGWALTGIEYYDSTNVAGTPAQDVSPSGLPIVGTGGPGSVANQTAGLVNWKTVGGPPFRGRTYFGGIAAGKINTIGNWDTSVLNALAAVAFGLVVLTDPNGPRARLTIRSTKSNVVPAGTVAQVSTSQVNPIPASQRRRRKGVGS